MRIAALILAPLILALACARERPPPKVVCEPPPPQKKNIRVGSCPIDWGATHDAAPDAPETSGEDAREGG